MLKDYVADLHIHTCLSPCGELSMSPGAIVAAALAHGIHLIAITDHNTARMTDAVAREAARRGVAFLYGLELQTEEEVHLLAYFDDAATAHAFSDKIYDRLPSRDNAPEWFGDQVIVDDDERIIDVETRLLLNSLRLDLETAVAWIASAGGLAVPAHVDREPYGLIAQLGFVPEGLRFPLAEADGEKLPPAFSDSALLWSSDAHSPDAIGRRATRFRIEEPTVAELRLAAATVGGRAMAVEKRGARRPERAPDVGRIE